MKFEELKPKVKKAMIMSAHLEDESEKEMTFGVEMNIEELLEEEPPLKELRTYLTGLDYEELKIIQSFMLTGRDVENRLEIFSNNDIEEMFERYSDKPDHAGNSGLVGYMLGKAPFREYLYYGLRAFEKIR